MQALRLKKKSAFILRLEKHWTNLQGRPEKISIEHGTKEASAHRQGFVFLFSYIYT